MSYEFRGTPGPWLKVDGKPFVYALNENGVNQFQVMVDGAYCGESEKEFNAVAVQAVPDLIEALVYGLDNLEYGSDIEDFKEVAEAALAKATGDKA